jgi:phosphosulfolactate phosphohydrolase-like enzyme
LHRLQIGYWTGVSIEDQVAASAISHYLEGNHAIFGFFDPNLFIHDLVQHRHEYCSSFLVNALLAHACVSVATPTLATPCQPLTDV